MYRFILLTVASTALALGIAAHHYPSDRTAWALPVVDITGASGAAYRYGAALKVGNGAARAYVLTDQASGVPLEIGIALSEQALEGLPSTGEGHHSGHTMPHAFLFDLPANHGTPYQFVEMNWNPGGHEPPGVYDTPHFDFHFWTASKTLRASILPEDPAYATKADHVPAKEYIPAFNLALGPPGAKPSEIAVPMMGVHWIDVRSAELQGLLGKPDAYKPFTATFIHGSWDGKLVFWEPMITRAHIAAKRTATDALVQDELIAIPLPARYQTPGYYPAAYRIMWDAKAREYRIALAKLAWRE